jgi:hypothetical protein
MIYSVWQPGSHVYRYYDVPEQYADDVPTPRRSGKSPIGAAPEEISWRLPASAQPVGSGEAPKGVVVHTLPSRPGGGAPSLGSYESLNAVNWLTLAVGGYFLSKALDHVVFGKKWGR